MRLLVTGATGFIGSRLALGAGAEGHRVVATGRAETEVEKGRLASLEDTGVHVAAGSLLEKDFAARMVAGCDAVIHLAAAQHEANVPDSYFREINVEATRNLLEAAVAGSVRRFAYGSTIGVYGSASDVALDEESPTRPENIYGRTKLEAESVVRRAAGRIETSIVRISETYGPGDLRLLKLFRAIDRGRFVMIGRGNNRRQVIHVEDLCRGLLLAATAPAAVGETFVLAGAEVMTTHEMAAKIAHALGRAAPRLRVPLGPVAAAAAIMEDVLKPFGIQPPLHRRRLDFFRKSFLFSTARAERLLGFQPRIGFSEGAAQTARWYREQGYLELR
jgi:nucleoside-diphosphate-sugar epimerase